MDIPKRIYHYTSRATALEHILPTKKIRIGSLGLTNDPRETKEWGFPVRLAPRPIDLDRDLDLVNQFQDAANRIRREDWWALCTCRDDPDLVEPNLNQPDLTHFKYGYARGRMWAQYAENHKGVCFEFDGLELHKAVAAAVGQNPLFFGPITYVDEWDVINLKKRGDAFQFSYAMVSDAGLEEGVRDHIRRHYQHFLLEKSPDWATESEFRWLVNSASGPFFVDITASLRSVIVGVDFPAVYGPSLWRLCEQTGARVERMNWNNRIPGKGIWEP
ncbi:MAG: DUF2971 domain-containing protein [Burkholderiales bacterium]